MNDQTPISPAGGDPLDQLLVQTVQQIAQAINGISKTVTALPAISGLPLPITQGGTGQSAQAPAFDALSPTTTRGDLIERGATSNVRLPLGANNTILESNGTDPGWVAVGGDATLSGGTLTIAGNAITTGKINNAAVTYAKIQNESATTLLGNPTGSAAAPSEITLGAALSFVSTALQTAAMTGDVTTSANSFATTIANNAVSNAKFRQGAALSVVGVTGNAAANVADIAGTAAQVLRVNDAGNALAFGQVDLSQSAAVTSVLQIANGGTGAAKANFVWVDLNGTNQTGIAQGTFTKVQFSHKNSDLDGVFDATTNFRYQPNVSGKFMIAGSLGITVGGGSNLTRAIASVFKNGSEQYRGEDTIIASAAALTVKDALFSVVVPMNGSTDFIEIFTFIQSSGGLADGVVAGNTVTTYFTAHRMNS